MKKAAIARFLPIFLLVILLIFPNSAVFAHLETTIHSGWAATTPTINGSIAAGEWATATVRNFTLEMRSRTDGTLNRTLAGRLYVMNNWTCLFLTVQIFNDDYEDQDFSNNWNGLAVLFDDNHDGVVSAGENGEGVTTFINSPYYSKNDLYYGTYWDADLNVPGKHNDGAIAWSHTNQTYGAIGNWTFEMMIPLVGTDGDAYDFAITTLPKTVGFKVWFQEPAKGVDGVYPDDPTINKNIQETSKGATFGNLIIHPLYTLTIITVSGGTTTPSPGQHQYPYNTSVQITAPLYVPSESGVGGARYVFSNWTVDSNYVPGNPITVIMDSNHTAEAHYIQQYKVTFTHTGLDSTATGTVVTVNAVPKSFTDLPYSFWVNNGSSVTYSYSSIISSTDSSKRFRLDSVTGPSSPITVIGPTNVTGNYVVQYRVTFAQTGLDSNATGTVVTVNSVAKTFTDLPYTLWVDSGTVVTYSYNTIVSSSTSGKRFALTSVTGPSSPITVTSAVNVTGNFKIQYYLTVNTDPTGLSPAPTPSSNWYDAGTIVGETAPSLSYKNSNEYEFKYWDVDGTSKGNGVNPISVTLNAPHTATAHYQIVPPPSVGGHAEFIQVSPPVTETSLITRVLLILISAIALIISLISLIHRDRFSVVRKVQ